MPRLERRTSRAPSASRRPGDRGQRLPARKPGGPRPLVADEQPTSVGIGSASTGEQPAVPARGPRRPWRPRLTGRAAVLVLVMAVLTVSYASSLKAYLNQRQHIAELKAEIARSQADIDLLEREKARWRDPAYVQSQARARFGYVMPGETSYVVLDEDGKPLEAQTSLLTTDEVLAKPPKAWFETAWESVLLAGNPPEEQERPEPLDKIGPDNGSGKKQ